MGHHKSPCSYPRGVIFAIALPVGTTYESKAPGWPRGMGTTGLTHTLG